MKEAAEEPVITLNVLQSTVTETGVKVQQSVIGEGEAAWIEKRHYRKRKQ